MFLVNYMKDNFKIFLISGKARHGKTTVAKIIQEYYKSHDVASVVTSLNKYIKMFAFELTSWDGSEETKPRTLLQTLGSEVIRGKLGLESFFVDRLDEDLCVYNEFANAVMIDDIRLPFEIEHFKAKHPQNVILVRVNRPNFENGLTDEQQHHETEIALDNYRDYDYTIKNDGSINDLKNEVFRIMEEIEK